MAWAATYDCSDMGVSSGWCWEAAAARRTLGNATTYDDAVAKLWPSHLVRSHPLQPRTELAVRAPRELRASYTRMLKKHAACVKGTRLTSSATNCGQSDLRPADLMSHVPYDLGAEKYPAGACLS